MSSPGSAILRIELPRWLAADALDAAVWIALAAALERVAGQAPLVPGVATLAVAAIGVTATVRQVRRRRKARALWLGADRLGLEDMDGRGTPLGRGRGTRVAAGTVFLAGQIGTGSHRWRCWLTSFDVRKGTLRGIARTLYLRAGRPPEA
jgi:hypothetical protein